MNPVDSYNQEISRHFKWNYSVNIADIAIYMFGYSFISPATILPLYLSFFTQNPMILGLIPLLNTAGFLLPQLFSSNWVERSPRKKFFPFVLGFFFERVPIFLMVPTVYFLAKNNPAAALWSFLILYAWHNIGAGMLIVGWQDLVAKIIPVDKRGKFFGISNFISNVTGIAGASAVTVIMDRFEFPLGFVAVFAIASLCILVSWIFLGLTREPPDPVTKPHISNREYFRRLPAVVRQNPNFRNFLIAQIINKLGEMGGGFFMVAALAKWPLNESTAASFTIAMLSGQAIANLALGFLADRTGHKLVMELSILFNILAFLFTILATSATFFYVVFLFRGLCLGAGFVAANSLPLEFSRPEDRPTFIGLTGTISGLTGALAPLAGGAIAAASGYNNLYGVSILISLAALGVLHFIVREPRRHSEPAAEPVL